MNKVATPIRPATTIGTSRGGMRSCSRGMVTTWPSMPMAAAKIVQWSAGLSRTAAAAATAATTRRHVDTANANVAARWRTLLLRRRRRWSLAPSNGTRVVVGDDLAVDD